MSNTNKQRRAKVGGETGMNGEQYAGGTFLPNTTLGKMGTGAKRTGGGKQMVAPYVWEIAPEGKKSLFATFREFVNLNTGEINGTAAAYYGRSVEDIANAYAAWKDGQRWI
jgi:hypothetical protein